MKANPDAIERLLSAFFAGRGPHTTDAYSRDLDAFAAFLRRHSLAAERPFLGKAGRDLDALRWFFEQPPGRANEIVLHFKSELLAKGKATGTTARHIGTIKSLAKYARMTGLIMWALEVQAPRIEKSRDTRGPSLDTIQEMLTLAAQQSPPANARDVALLRLAFDLALRIGELARLDVADVELKTGGLWILGKGRKAKQLITMPQTSRDAVRAWLQVRGMKQGPLFLSFSRARRRADAWLHAAVGALHLAGIDRSRGHGVSGPGALSTR